MKLFNAGVAVDTALHFCQPYLRPERPVS